MFLLFVPHQRKDRSQHPNEWIPVSPPFFSIRRDCSFGQHERKAFKMQRALKVKCHVRAQVLKRQRDFNDAVGLQVALLMGSDR